jgi:copper chaperone CopZ
MSCYMHNVPGRLRIKTPLIKKNINLAAHVEKFLGQISGVESLVTNALTGSVTITYDSKKVTSQMLIETLKTRGIFDPSKAMTNDQYIHSSASKATSIVYKAFVGAVVESFLEGSALSLLAVFI